MGERELEYFVRSWKLTPSSGGVFVVTVNGEVVFSKKEVGRHAEEGELKTLITQAIEKFKPAE